MKLLLLLTTMTPLLGSISAICHACFDHICYTKRKVFEAEEIIGQIAVDRMENQLHLHYKDYASTDHTAVVDLNRDELMMLELPVHYSYARAVDQTTGEVYFSGSKGIYKYNSLTKQTAPYGQFRRQIWHMQFKGKLYFTEYQQKGMFYIENNLTRCISPLSEYIIDDFIIDKFGDIYFTSYFIMYRLKENATEPKLFSAVLYGLTTDIHDNVYFVDANTRMVYTMNYENYNLVEFGMFGAGAQVFRMVFDRMNRIIYLDATDDKVYLLSANSAFCNLVKKTE